MSVITKQEWEIVKQNYKSGDMVKITKRYGLIIKKEIEYLTKDRIVLSRWPMRPMSISYRIINHIEKIKGGE